jgi:hypothetical protein
MYYQTHRLYYTHQLLFAKSSIRTSYRLYSLVHLIDSQKYKNDVFSIGIGSHNKITRKTALTYEYFYVFPSDQKPTEFTFYR